MNCASASGTRSTQPPRRAAPQPAPSARPAGVRRHVDPALSRRRRLRPLWALLHRRHGPAGRRPGPPRRVHRSAVRGARSGARAAGRTTARAPRRTGPPPRRAPGRPPRPPARSSNSACSRVATSRSSGCSPWRTEGVRGVGSAAMVHGAAPVLAAHRPQRVRRCRLRTRQGRRGRRCPRRASRWWMVSTASTIASVSVTSSSWLPASAARSSVWVSRRDSVAGGRRRPRNTSARSRIAVSVCPVSVASSGTAGSSGNGSRACRVITDCAYICTAATTPSAVPRGISSLAGSVSSRSTDVCALDRARRAATSSRCSASGRRRDGSTYAVSTAVP